MATPKHCANVTATCLLSSTSWSSHSICFLLSEQRKKIMFDIEQTWRSYGSVKLFFRFTFYAFTLVAFNSAVSVEI